MIFGIFSVPILWYDAVVDTQDASQPIVLNCRVTVELVDSSGGIERGEFTLVTAKQADFKSGLLDENTPLGCALLGRHAGENIPYAVGDLREVRILAVESGEGSVSPEAAQKRRADVRKAKAQSEITNQMIFSTASGSKWGDYDVNMDKLLENDEEEPDE
jgi:Transcription elongation factor, GreA/GreB, C-term